ncbi:hypothetical protein CEXT_148361 [Caerostris extrusa]|uniref:Uncharacterized protein n=1 Tax=Caerostris extrusa TaxID=172846 RepID=A0AAV4V973_CAEEX|nr:hypothetical protein CEXT_148361 [Caerostris extrusa]
MGHRWKRYGSNGIIAGNSMIANGIIGGHGMIGNGVIAGNGMLGNGIIAGNGMLGNGIIGGHGMLGNGVIVGNGMLGNGVIAGNGMLGNGIIGGHGIAARPMSIGELIKPAFNSEFEAIAVSLTHLNVCPSLSEQFAIFSDSQSEFLAVANDCQAPSSLSVMECRSLLRDYMKNIKGLFCSGSFPL